MNINRLERFYLAPHTDRQFGHLGQVRPNQPLFAHLLQLAKNSKNELKIDAY